MTDEVTQPDQPQTPEELADQFKKDELKTAAAVQGVEVASGDTKADIAEKLVAAQPVVQPVQVDGRNRKSDEDGLEGHFVNVVDGEHKGRLGAFVSVVEREADGYPKQILVRTRDEYNQLLSVAYKHVRHAGDYHGGR